MAMTIASVGYYDRNGVYFEINPMNGFEANSTELAAGVVQYVVRARGCNNNVQGYTEIVVSREFAHDLSDFFSALHDAERERS